MIPNQFNDIDPSALLRLLKLEHISAQKRNELLLALEEMSFHVALNFILENLKEKDAETFLDLLDHDQTEEKAFDFAKSKITNFDDQLAELLLMEIKNLM